MIEHLKNHEDIKEVNPLIWNDVENIDFPKNLNLSSSKKLLLNNKENSDTNTLKLEKKPLKEYQILKENKEYIFDKKDVEISLCSQETDVNCVVNDDCPNCVFCFRALLNKDNSRQFHHSRKEIGLFIIRVSISNCGNSTYYPDVRSKVASLNGR